MRRRTLGIVFTRSKGLGKVRQLVWVETDDLPSSADDDDGVSDGCVVHWANTGKNLGRRNTGFEGCGG